jgi:multiple sugar transport system ATP-binding protein
MDHLELRSLGKSFRTNQVLKDLSLTVETGEIIVIFGASGTGKTVLLRLIAGVEEPSEGSIAIEGGDMSGVPPEERDIGMAFQNFALFPHLSAYENVASPLRARGEGAAGIDQRVHSVARLLKIDHVLAHAPRELSNGQKQRTALARALVASPKLLLLDDPLRNVDAKLRFEMRLELPRLLRGAGSTVLYVTQDYKEAMALADRIAVLEHGNFVQVGTPEEVYAKPATLSVARLFGDPTINLADATVSVGGLTANIGHEAIELGSSYGGEAGKTVTAGMRPEAVRLSTSGRSIEAEVMAVTPLNERTVLLLRSKGNLEFLASLPASKTIVPASGSKVRVSFDPGGVHLFDQATGLRLLPARAEDQAA